MALVSDTELKSAVKSGKIANVYYLYGKDYLAVENSAKLIISKVLKNGDEVYNLHAFNGKEMDIGEFTEACEALPMFADYVCCTVCDLNAETLNADNLNTIISTVNDLPDSTILIFYNTSVDVTDGKKFPTTKNKKLIDAVIKVGTVCNYAYKTAKDLSVLITAKVNKCGGIISKQAAEYLANLCGCNTMIIGNEIDKLLAYSGKNEITVDTINLMSPRQLESTTFDLAKAIVKHDKRNAMRLLDELMIQKVEVISILYAVTANMVDIYRARVALSSGKSMEDVKNDFAYPKNLAFRVEVAFREVKSLSVTHLRECMKILTQADIDMKSLKTDKQIILEEAVIKMLSHR